MQCFAWSMAARLQDLVQELGLDGKLVVVGVEALDGGHVVLDRRNRELGPVLIVCMLACDSVHKKSYMVVGGVGWSATGWWLGV